jgi:hypothetical protein
MFDHGMSQIAQLLMTIAPTLGICAFGAVFAVTQRRRSPVAARLVFAGVGLIALALAINLLMMSFADRIFQAGWSPEQALWAFGVIGFVTSGLSAVGTFLLIMAAFAGRPREE